MGSSQITVLLYVFYDTTVYLSLVFLCSMLYIGVCICAILKLFEIANSWKFIVLLFCRIWSSYQEEKPTLHTFLGSYTEQHCYWKPKGRLMAERGGVVGREYTCLLLTTRSSWMCTSLDSDGNGRKQCKNCTKPQRISVPF